MNVCSSYVCTGGPCTSAQRSVVRTHSSAHERGLIKSCCPGKWWTVQRWLRERGEWLFRSFFPPFLKNWILELCTRLQCHTAIPKDRVNRVTAENIHNVSTDTTSPESVEEMWVLMYSGTDTYHMCARSTYCQHRSLNAYRNWPVWCHIPV